MTAVGYDPVYLATLLVIGLGALTFSVLTLHYWRQPSARRDPVFAAFTLACAASFLINIAARMAPDRWETTLAAALDLATGAIPALLFHLVSQGRGRAVRLAFYAVSGAIAIALVLDDLDVWAAPFRDQAPAILLAIAGALALAFLHQHDPRLRIWYAALLLLTVASAIAGLISPSPLAILAPDFLLLAFLCVTLYYRERLIFFDLLIKRGIFLGIALCALTLSLSAGRVPGRLTVVFLCAPLLLLAPWLDGMLSRAVDKLFLGRRYSPADAERIILREVQAAVTEDDLRQRAERSFSEIFACSAQVRFTWPLPPNPDEVVAATLPGAGDVVLRPRASGIPFMTDDRRLLSSLTATLAIALENVRFRERHERQVEREQQLRLLASRAELRALRAQINPHFLFNALNAIAGLLPSRPDLADYAIEQLALVFRYTLRKSEREWARLDEEAEFATAYLGLHQARFGDRLAVEFTVDPDAAAVSVPAMCVQPIVENAVRHGASMVEGAGFVGVRIRLDGAAASIEVRDNGPGFPPGFSLAASSGHGLRNVAERLKGYYGDSAQLSWESGGNCTRVLLKVPRELPGVRS